MADVDNVDKLAEMMARVSLDQEKRWAEFRAQADSRKVPKTAATKTTKKAAGKVPARKRPSKRLEQLTQAFREDLEFRARDVETLTIAELVELYGSGCGGDDSAGPELKRRGAPARDELIRMLDGITMAELEDPESQKFTAILDIIQYCFPSEKCFRALEKLDARLPNCVGERTFARLRAKLSGQDNAAWWKRHAKMSPSERGLHHEELLLANCRPKAKALFLMEAARAALDAFEAARQTEDKAKRINGKKAEAYARKILATPDLAAKSGEAVHYGNHVLGMLAFYQGQLARAKKYLIEASKAREPWFVSAVPDWALVEALLAEDERETVCEYLDNMKAAAKSGSVGADKKARELAKRSDALFDRWKKAVLAGKTPDFGEGVRWMTK